MQAVPGAIAAALVFYYALRGGSYDIVVRQEETAALWWLLGVLVVTGLVRSQAIPARGSLTLSALALLAIWTAVSFAWTESADRTLAEVVRVLHYLGIVLAAWLLVGRGNWRATATGVAAATIAIALLSLASRLAPGAFPTDEVARAFHTDRLSYPLGYWNAIAAWGAMSIAIALAWSAHARSALWRGIWLAMLPACALVVYFTYSRGGVIGSGAAVTVVVALARNRWTTAAHVVIAGAAGAGVIAVARAQPELAKATGGAGGWRVLAALAAAAIVCILGARLVAAADLDARLRLAPRHARALLIAMTVLAGIALATVGRGPATDAWDNFRSGKDPGSGATRLTALSGNRYAIWSSAVRAFEAHPLEGTGAGTFEFWWNRDGGVDFLRDAHSLYLEPFAETGVVGGVLVLLVVVALAVAALIARRLAAAEDFAAYLALVAGYLVFLVHAGFDWMWESTAPAAVALAAATLAAGVDREEAQKALRGRRVWLPVISVLVVALALPGLVATSLIRKSQAAAHSGNQLGALARAGDAIAASPWSGSAYVQRALVEESVGSLEAADADLGRAIDNEPTDWRSHLLRARVAAERGQARRALALYRKARRLRPQSPFFYTPG